MKCESYQTDLKAYSDQELPLFRRLAVRRHLAGCASCRSEVRTMEQTTKNLQAAEPVEPLSKDLRTRILAEAAKEGKPSGTPSSSFLTGVAGRKRIKHRLSPALVGAICTGFAVAAFFAIHPVMMPHVMVETHTDASLGNTQTARQAAPSEMSKATPMTERQVMSGVTLGYRAPSGSQTASVPRGSAESYNYLGGQTAAHGNSFKTMKQDEPATSAWSSEKPGHTNVVVVTPKFTAASNTGYDSDGVVAKVPVHPVNTPESSSASTSYSLKSPTENKVVQDGSAVVAQATPQMPAPLGAPTAGYRTNINGFGGGAPLSAGGAAGAPSGVYTRDEVNAPTGGSLSAGPVPATPAPGATAGGVTFNGNSQSLGDYYNLSFNRQVHREANVTVQLKDPEAASDQVNQMVKDAGGYVASNNLTTDDSGAKSAQMILKVPVAQFDTVLGQIEKLGNVTAKNVTGEDITGKVSDSHQAESVLDDESTRADAHLKALGQRARWEDVEDARNLHIELAQARARVQLLGKLAALADITVSFTQTPAPVQPSQSGFLDNLKGNGSAAFQSLVSSVAALLTMLIWALAYAPIWGPLAFAAWYAIRRKQERSQMNGV